MKVLGGFLKIEGLARFWERVAFLYRASFSGSCFCTGLRTWYQVSGYVLALLTLQHLFYQSGFNLQLLVHFLPGNQENFHFIRWLTRIIPDHYPGILGFLIFIKCNLPDDILRYIYKE